MVKQGDVFRNMKDMEVYAENTESSVLYLLLQLYGKTALTLPWSL